MFAQRSYFVCSTAGSVRHPAASASRNCLTGGVRAAVVPLLLATAAGLVLSLGGVRAVAAKEGRPPNIVLIVADDQTFSDFGFMGSTLVETPHLDRLAGHSARYVNGYVPSSVCRPSLATLLTGLYPHQHGIHFNHPPPGNAALGRFGKEEFNRRREDAIYLIRAAATLPRILARHGYVSLQTGKHWEGHYRNAGFTHGMTLAEASPEPAYGNKRLPDGSLVAHGNGDAGLNIGRTTMQPLYEFIDAHAKEPMLIWYAPFLPHEPHKAPQDILDRYAAKAEVPEQFRRYYASCTWFDRTVGDLVDYMERKGLARETIFVFVSDNGWQPSRTPHPRYPGYGVDARSKRSPFEAGLRTPILIRWDGRVAPATHEALCSTVDILPTLLDALQLEGEANDLPGRSLFPSAVGEKTLADRPVFGEIYPGDATSLGHPSRDVAYRWIRDGDFKLITTHSESGRPWGGYLRHTSLFNLREDPLEQHDLSRVPRYADRLAALRKQLDAWWTPGDDRDVPPPPPR